MYVYLCWLEIGLYVYIHYVKYKKQVRNFYLVGVEPCIPITKITRGSCYK